MVPFEIAPLALKARLDAGEEMILLDVREAEELALARIEGALHIPMEDVPSRTVEIDEEIPIVVICHLGQRSAMVTHFLRGRDFENVMNLRGGIEAWAREVDPSVGRY
ncbi:MAG: rhodanese-like domain-containing protein [bacterium]|nr:rhodanese-like domain-containing protein [bacterium]